MATALLVVDAALDDAVQRWLFAKGLRSSSPHTRRNYAQTLAAFRAALAAYGLDLDSDPAQVAAIAEVWAAARTPQATRQGAPTVKASTHNHRLVCLSSFYVFAMRQQLAGITCNPVKPLERHSTKDSTHATVLTADGAAAKLKAIDRSTPAGMRDYALLSIALYTGRRASELAGLRAGDVARSGCKIVLTFRHTKGGGQMVDELPASISAALLAYCDAVHGDIAELPADAPLWLSFARNRSAGHAITTQAIADICAKHLGVSTIHSTRHTFAKAMDDLGAPVTTIQRRLGHSSLATTARYLHSLPQPVNPLGDQLAAALGIE